MSPHAFASTLPPHGLSSLVAGQLNTFFPDGQCVETDEIMASMESTLQRVNVCFQNIHRKYYNENGSVVFNHLHSDHYAAFLYLLSNTLYKQGGRPQTASKLFLLNKALHGLDAFYAVELPEVFLFIHPLGTVLGNATYGNFFTVYQNCGVGALDESGDYPFFGEGVVLYARSCVLGACRIGRDVVFGANSFLVATNVPDHSVVVGQYPAHRILPNNESVLSRIFHVESDTC